MPVKCKFLKKLANSYYTRFFIRKMFIRKGASKTQKPEENG